MNTFFRIPAVMGMAWMASGLVACQPVSVAPQSTPDSPASASLPTEPAPPSGWAEILGATPAPAGWQVAPCDTPVLLCVTANGEQVGTVERFRYPLSDIDLAAAVAPAPGAELDYLRAWVAEHYATIERDRRSADRAWDFTAAPPTEISVGGLPGLRYHLALTQSDGTGLERYVGYVTTDEEFLQVFVTAVINGDSSGSFSDNAALQQFEPYLDDIIRGLSLAEPPAQGRHHSPVRTLAGR